MRHEDKKAAIAAYKERKPVAGIFAVRCGASGQCWVGRSLNLAMAQNGLWFALRQGSSPFRGLQAAWQAHGPDSFSFETVERLPEEELAYVRDRALKDRLAHWSATLPAQAI